MRPVKAPVVTLKRHSHCPLCFDVGVHNDFLFVRLLTSPAAVQSFEHVGSCTTPVIAEKFEHIKFNRANDCWFVPHVPEQ